MATLSFKADAELTLCANVSATVSKNFDRPEADLRRWPTITVQTEDAPVYKGYPKLPLLWFRGTPTASGAGVYTTGARPSPGDVSTDSDVRWLPYAGTFNVTTGVWSPWHTTSRQFPWQANTGAAQPALGTLTYRLGREVISVPQMAFSGSQYMASNFDSGTADAVSFTISMVVVMSAAKSVPYPLLDWGTSSWTTGPPPASRTYMLAGSKILYGWANGNSSVDPIAPLTSLRPAFITMVVSPPAVDVYVSSGSRHCFHTSATSSLVIPSTPMQFFVNKSALASVLPGQFSLPDMSLWGRSLSPAEVADLNATYASVYGASSEWS
jgi:hypothetical protein